MNQFRYILRYYIDPGFHEEDRIAELLDLCKQATVDEVMLFFNAEETNTGHYTMQELEAWLPTAHRIKDALETIGVDLSINPWTTLVHCNRGRKLKPGQNYNLMVGDTGRDNAVTACPLDQNWLDDLCILWQRVARELTPTTIWMEDDFRYHNHGNLLGYGGCYCKEHMKEFSRRYGRPVDRQELLELVWGKEFDPNARAIWLDLCQETFLHIAARLEEAVHQGCPETSMGLMSGYFDSSSIEGRDWPRLKDTLSVHHRLSFRPTMSPYTEVWTMRRAPVNARMTVSALGKPLNVYPELESGPRHGPYSLGTSCAACQILEAACFGAQGITMNLFDMMGCGTCIDPRMGAKLGSVRPRLETLRQLGIDDQRATGAKILMRQDIARYAPGAGVKAQCGSSEWGHAAAVLGFSFSFTQTVEDSNEPYVVGGHVVTALSDDEIRKLLTQKVLLDGMAVRDLMARGFGPLIGIRTATVRSNEFCDYSYEEVPETDPAVYGLTYPRLTTQRAALAVTELDPEEKADILTQVKGPDHAYKFPGAVSYRNGLGGHVISLCYDIGEQGLSGDFFYFGYFSNLRRIFMQRLLRTLAPQGNGAFVENEPFRCYCSRLADGNLFAGAVNATTDELDGITMRIQSTRITAARRLLTDGAWSTEQLTIRHDGEDSIIRLDGPVKVYDGAFLVLTVN